MRRSEMSEEQRKTNDFLVELAAKKTLDLRAAESGTPYEQLMAKSDLTGTMALIFQNAKDNNLTAFYKAASDGYRIKALNLKKAGVC